MYGINTPTVENEVVVVDFAIVNAGDCVPLSVCDAGDDVVVPDCAEAVLTIEPASRSDCTTV